MTVLQKPRKPQLGDMVQAETLVAYLGQRRGTLCSFADRISVTGSAGEEHFELIRNDRRALWKRTR